MRVERCHEEDSDHRVRAKYGVPETMHTRNDWVNGKSDVQTRRCPRSGNADTRGPGNNRGTSPSFFSANLPPALNAYGSVIELDLERVDVNEGVVLSTEIRPDIAMRNVPLILLVLPGGVKILCEVSNLARQLSGQALVSRLSSLVSRGERRQRRCSRESRFFGSPAEMGRGTAGGGRA